MSLPPRAHNDNCRHDAARRAQALFFAWLVWLPGEADPKAAARAEIARLDRRPGAGPVAARLRPYLVQLVEASDPDDARTRARPRGARHRPALPEPAAR